MAEIGKSFFVVYFLAYRRGLMLLAAPLMLWAADVPYTWTAAKPDQAENVEWHWKNCSWFFCHLLAGKWQLGVEWRQI